VSIDVTVLVMAIEILSSREIAHLRAACRAAAETLAWVGAQLRPGVSTADIDAWVRADTARRGGRPSQLGYKMSGTGRRFPAAVCTSVNDVVCHGIPSRSVVLREGDLVNVDVTTELDGFHGDTSRTFLIGRAEAASATAHALVTAAEQALRAGIAVVREGARLGDVGAAVSSWATSRGYAVVEEFGGHGIGRRMHQDPHVAHFGVAGTGVRLRKGMAFTIEPMLNAGTGRVRYADDGWTVRTDDGSLSAQFEHTVLVTEDGCEVLTSLD
jgi:methionyl aminopeptidase